MGVSNLSSWCWLYCHKTCRPSSFLPVGTICFFPLAPLFIAFHSPAFLQSLSLPGSCLLGPCKYCLLPWPCFEDLPLPWVFGSPQGSHLIQTLSPKETWIPESWHSDFLLLTGFYVLWVLICPSDVLAGLPWAQWTEASLFPGGIYPWQHVSLGSWGESPGSSSFWVSGRWAWTERTAQETISTGGKTSRQPHVSGRWLQSPA